MSTDYAATLAAEIMARALAKSATSDVGPAGEIETVPECKILYRNGKPTDDAITERPRLSLAWKFGPGAEPRPKQPTTPIPAFAHPGPKPKARKRVTGRGKGWGKIPGLTAESAAAGILAGRTIQQIAEQYKCDWQTASCYLVQARKRNPEFRQAEAAMKLCKCGRPKVTYKPICAWCAKRQVECSAEGCSNRAHVKGMCAKHYYRHYRQMPIAGPGTPSVASEGGSAGKETRESV